MVNRKDFIIIIIIIIIMIIAVCDLSVGIIFRRKTLSQLLGLF